MTQKLCENLFVWLKLFLPSDTTLNYDLLSDGHFLNDIFRNINREAAFNKLLSSCSNIMDKVQNWEILINNIRIYYAELLKQVILMRLPNIVVICRDPNSHQSNEEIDKAILLIFMAAVQCERKEYFIQEISAKIFDKSVELSLLDFIKQIGQKNDLIINHKNISLLSTAELLSHLKRISEHRDDNLLEDWKTLLIEINDLHHTVEKTKIGLEFPTTDIQYNNATVSESMEYKAKWRKLQNDLDEKCDIIAELRQQLDNHLTEKAKHLEVQLKLQNETRRVIQLQSELDSQAEMMIRFSIIKLEKEELKKKVEEMEYFKTRCKELRNELASVTNEKVELLDNTDNSSKDAEKLRKLENECKDSNQEIEKLKQNYNCLDESLSVFVKENIILLRENENLNKEVTTLSESNARLENMVKLAEDNHKNTEKDHINIILHQNLKSTQNDFSKTKDEGKIEDDTSSLAICESKKCDDEYSEGFIQSKQSRRHSTSSKKEMTINEKLTKKTERISVLQKTVSSMTIRDKELSQAISDMDIKYQILQEKYDLEIRWRDVIVQSSLEMPSDSSLTEINDEICKLKDKNAELCSEKLVIENESHILNEKVSSLETNIESINSRCKYLNNQNLKFQVDKTRMQSQLSTLKVENESLKSQISANNECIATSTDKQTNMTQNLYKLKCQCESIEQSNKELSAKYEILKKNFDQNVNDNTLLSMECERQTNDNADINAKLEQQRTSNTTLALNLKEQKDRTAAIRSDLDQQIIDNSALSAELNRQRSLCDNLRSELNSQKLSLVQELESKNKELEKIKKSYDTLKNIKEMLENENRNMLEDESHRLKDLKMENANISEECDLLLRNYDHREIELKRVIQDNRLLISERRNDKIEITRLKEINNKIINKANQVEEEVEKLTSKIQSLIDHNEQLEIGYNTLLHQMKSMVIQNQNLLSETLQNKQDYYTEENTLRNRINQLEWQKEYVNAKINEQNTVSPSISRNDSDKRKSFRKSKDEPRRKDSATITDEVFSGSQYLDFPDEGIESKVRKTRLYLDRGNSNIEEKYSPQTSANLEAKYLTKTFSLPPDYQRPKSFHDTPLKQAANESTSPKRAPIVPPKFNMHEASGVTKQVFQTNQMYSDVDTKKYPITRLPVKKSISQYNPDVLLRQSRAQFNDSPEREGRYIPSRNITSPIFSQSSSDRQSIRTRPQSARPVSANNDEMRPHDNPKSSRNTPTKNTEESRPLSRTGSEQMKLSSNNNNNNNNSNPNPNKVISSKPQQVNTSSTQRDQRRTPFLKKDRSGNS